jgi:hypothetical protein
MSCDCDEADLYVRCGDDVNFSVTVTDGSGNPYSLAGILGIQCSLVGTMGTKDVTLTYTLGNGVTVSSPPTAGIFVVGIPRADSSTLKPGLQYGLEIRLKLSDNTVVTILEGTAEAQPQLVAIVGG